MPLHRHFLKRLFINKIQKMKKTALIITFLSILVSTALCFTAEPDKGIIKGRVTDENGNGLQGTGIIISGTYFGVYSGTEGNYEFTGLKNGKYILQFSFVGYKTVTAEVILNDLEILNVSLVTEPFVTGEIVITGTRAGNKTPVAQSNVDMVAIKKLNSGVDLPYILSLTPSLVETSEAGNGVGYTNMRIRGTDASRINVTIDGIPLNEPESQQVFWVDLPDLASSVDNIQIQRGVGTSSNGSGAFGGTVNIQTKSPDNNPFAEISTGMGSFNTRKLTATIGTGLLGENLSFLMRYSDLKSDGYVDRTFSKNNSLFMSGVYYTAKSRIKANIILGKERTGISWNGVPAELLAIDRTYNPSGEYTDEYGTKQYYKGETDNYTQNHYQLFYSLNINRELSLNTSLHYTTGAGYYEQYKEDEAILKYGMPTIEIGEIKIMTSDLIRRKWMETDFYGVIYSLNYRKNKIEATIGGGINRYIGDHFGKVIWMRYAGISEIDYQWYLNNSVKNEFNIYGKITLALTDKLNLFADMQYRNINYRMNGFDDDSVFLLQNHVFNFFNPKTGIFYTINPNQDTYLSFAVANREPTRDNYQNAAGDNKATPKPETLYDFESGYNFRSDKITLNANLYYMLYQDQLVPTGELSNVGYPIMTNVNKSYRTGIELTAGIKPNDFLRWNINLTLSKNRITGFVEYYTDYNTNDWTSEYKSKQPANVDIAYSPSVISSSDLVWMPVKRGEIHLISKYVGRQYFDNTQSSKRSLNPYFVNNLKFDYSFELKKIKSLDLQFFVNNILNTLYENNAYGGNWYENGMEKTWAYYFPQAGINYMINLSLKF
jgi:iron complex outermembrane recepter protein